MNRTIFFIATVVVAGTINMAPAASAGCQTNYATPRYYSERRPRARVSIRPSKRIRAREIAAAKSKEKVRAIAVARTKAKAKAIAAAHSPAIEAPPLPVRANIKRADVPTGVPKVVVADAKFKPAEVPSKPIDCKKFVPSAGLTITVSCE